MDDAPGNASLNGKLVTVFGGSGFLGRYIVRELAKRGYRVRVAVRRPDLAGHVQPMGAVGQIHAVQANLRYGWSVDRAIEGADAVVNLVGILFEKGKQSFEAVQGEGPGLIAQACAKAGISNLVQVSAIGADSDADAAYARSKAAGEAAVRASVPDAIIMRPSIVFGPEDDFFNRFANMARMSPILPVVGPQTRFQPVYVGDVADAVALAVDGGATPGTIYELGGPEIDTFEGLMERMLHIIERRRAIIAMPDKVAELQARVFELLPKPILTVDQIKMLANDNVVSDAALAEQRTLQGLGLQPAALEAILPTYLWRYRKHGQYSALGAKP
ncbi:MAG: complex I NDUFA9 subunit family protein [Devosiaceae bacterium]|nr:complex I NDUFA9 subunit family protein [Devosiaceae bacterium MH13]